MTDLILAVFQLNGRLLAAGDRIANPAGQRSARWQVLGAIPDRADTVAGIARRMGLARQSVQRTADLLEAEGLVEYANNPAHRRAKLVRLTSRGRSVLIDIMDRQIAWVNRLAAALGVDEREIRRAVRLLARFCEELGRAHATPDRSLGMRRSPARTAARRRSEK